VLRVSIWLFVLLSTFSVMAQEEDPVVTPDLGVRVGRLLGDDYYDRSRIRPRLIIERALRTLEGAEVSIDTSWQGGLIDLRIGEKTWQVPAPEPRTLPEAMALIDRLRSVLIKESGLPLRRANDLGYALLNGGLSSLDPHTVLMPPEPADEFDEDIRGEFGGIGAYLHQEAATGEVIIERVMPERPAEKSGVEDGDVIVAVDGETTAGLSLSQCERRIMGPTGTTVTLTLRRKAQVFDLAVVRDIVLVPTMRGWREGDVGYIRMDEFNAKTAKMLFDEIVSLQAAGKLGGLVLDLRYNGGGLLEQAKVISDFFLQKDKEIVETVTLGGEPNRFMSSPRRLLECPMIVLVGPGSASAAEILSGALQRNDRAVVAGSTSFGKGSVQSIRPLPDGSRLKLTIQEYRLAGGVSIQDVGVMPDLRLMRRSQRENGSVDLMPFSSSREEDEEFALVVGDTYQHVATYQMGWLAESRTREQMRESVISSREFHPDQEAMLAVKLLTQAIAVEGAQDVITNGIAKQTERQALLELLKTPVAVLAEQEAKALAAALAAAPNPIVWGPDTVVPAADLSIRYIGPDTLVPGQTADLTFAVSNASDQDVGRLYAVLTTDRSSPLFEEEIIIGAVPAHGETVGRRSFAVPPRIYAGEERFSVELRRDGDAEPIVSVPVRVMVAAAPRPHLSFRWALAEGAELKAGETTPLQVTLINDGDGATAPLALSVYKDNDANLQLGDGVFRLDPLAAGAEATVSIPLILNEKAASPEITLLLQAEERFEDDVDSRYRATLFHKLTIPMGAKVEGAVVVQPTITAKAVTVNANGTADISVDVKGDGLRFVGAFLDRDKVDLRPASELVEGVYHVKVQLAAGFNSVRVMASGADDITEVLALRMWSPDNLPVKPAAEATAQRLPEAPAPVVLP
jgi:C-terminal peptidase prc